MVDENQEIELPSTKEACDSDTGIDDVESPSLLEKNKVGTALSQGGGGGHATSTVTTTCTNPSHEFHQTCRFVIETGKAAYRYGSLGAKIEEFLPKLLQRYNARYRGLFRATQSELFCTVMETSEHNNHNQTPMTLMVPLRGGMNLHKLSLLAALIDRILADTASTPEDARNANEEKEENVDGTADTMAMFVDVMELEQNPLLIQRSSTNVLSQVNDALQELQNIDVTPDPWNIPSLLASYIGVGGGVALLLGGIWWDIAVASGLGAFSFLIENWLVPTVLGARFAPFVFLLCSFGCALVATAIQQVEPAINVVIVTLSAVAIQLPGYTVSLGVGEVVSNRIVSGVSNLIQGLVVLLWLVMGALLGQAVVLAVASATHPDDAQAPDTTSYSKPSMAWQGLFVPILCVSLNVVFQQQAPGNFIWSVLHLGLTYGSSYVAGLFTRSNLGIFLSTVVMTVSANVWGRCYNRPNTLLLVPGIVLQVSGTIGFQGVFKLVSPDGDNTVGQEQFLQMIVVALLILAGLLAGNALFVPGTTL